MSEHFAAFHTGQIVDDSTLPFFAPIIPADSVVADLDQMSQSLTQGTLDFSDFNRLARKKILAPANEGGWSDYAFVRMTTNAIAIVDSNRGIHTPSPAHLFIQQGAAPHHHPDFMMLVCRDGQTGTTRAIAAEPIRFILPATQSASSAINIADIHDAEVDRRLNGNKQTSTELRARIIGDGKAFDPKNIFTPIPLGYIAGLMHHYTDLLATVIKPEFMHTCSSPRLSGSVPGIKQIGAYTPA